MLVLASNNQGKLTEIKALLLPRGIEVKSAAELGFTEDIAETGSSFMENANIKASHIAQALNLPALADDSGLVVPALDGAPGVRSARYAGEKASDAENNQKLLQAMAGIDKRAAYFVCSMMCVKPDGSAINAEGLLAGLITHSPQGVNGFGYDPLFMVPELGKTLAQTDAAEKNAISHRGQALRKILDRLPAFLGF